MDFFLGPFSFLFMYLFYVFGAAAIAVGLHLVSFRSQK
jgi:hypothetical protein